MNAIRNYFLFAAEKPGFLALVISLAFSLPFLAILKLNLVPDYNYLWSFILRNIVYMIVTLYVIHRLVDLFWITSFPKIKNTIFFVNNDGALEIYSSPIWGKVSFIPMNFPDNWNLNDDESVIKPMHIRGLVVHLPDGTYAHLSLDLKILFHFDCLKDDMEKFRGTLSNNDQGQYEFQKFVKRILLEKLSAIPEVGFKLMNIKNTNNNDQFKQPFHEQIKTIDLNCLTIVESTIHPPKFTDKKPV